MPLTGVVSATGRAERPAIAVRIDNTRDAAPQRGLTSADVVIENLVEGRLTRLLVVFHSEVPSSVGPVRSARSTDADLLPAFGTPGFVYWSSNDGVAQELGGVEFSGGMVDLGLDTFPDGYEREEAADRPVELTGFADLPLLEGSLDQRGAPPPELFPRRADGDDRTAPLVPGIAIAWGALQDVSWVWSGDAWVRSQFGGPHLDDTGTVVTAANVVVIETGYVPSAADERSPQAVSLGSGAAMVLTDGALIEATWDRPSVSDPWRLTDTAGAPVRLAPGVTWIEIVEPDLVEAIDPGRVSGLLADAAPFLPET